MSCEVQDMPDVQCHAAGVCQGLEKVLQQLSVIGADAV